MQKQIPMWRTKFLAIWYILSGKYKHFVLLNTDEQGKAILSRKTLSIVLGDCLVVDIVQHGLKNSEIDLLLKHMQRIAPTPFSSKESDEIEVTAVKKKLSEEIVDEGFFEKDTTNMKSENNLIPKYGKDSYKY
jgi:hypothetical protein